MAHSHCPCPNPHIQSSSLHSDPNTDCSRISTKKYPSTQLSICFWFRSSTTGQYAHAALMLDCRATLIFSCFSFTKKLEYLKAGRQFILAARFLIFLLPHPSSTCSVAYCSVSLTLFFKGHWRIPWWIFWTALPWFMIFCKVLFFLSHIRMLGR